MKVVTSAPSKLILCGEHFVVYGAPAIAIPTNNRNKVILTSKEGAPKVILRSNLGEAVYFNGKFEGNDAFRIFIPVINYILNNRSLSETIEIEIVHSGAPKGMGSSASLGGALGLALYTYFGKSCSDDDLFECAQLVDEIAHGGRPSGIDARTTTRGRPQKFQRSFEPAQFNFEDLDLQFNSGSALIVVDTFKGERETTGQLIEKFAMAHNITKKPNEMTEEERKKFLSAYSTIYEEFVRYCCKNGNPERLGKVFNANHNLLFSASTPEIEEVRRIAMQGGAYGAKLTGAGGKGGAVIILAPSSKSKDIISKLSNSGYKAFIVDLAKDGAKVEMIE